ncbi:MAG TPA: histidine kinase [Thermoanaerobaculia bacterium]|nr:histidine kinase [Thermoanaerobaculia bacterium]
MIRLFGTRFVVRYVVIFWAFYELLVIPALFFQPRFFQAARDLPSTIVYSVIDGSYNVIITLLSFAFVDFLAAWKPRARIVELLTLAVYLIAVVLIMIALDSWLRTIFSPPHPRFGEAWVVTLTTGFHDTLLIEAFLLGLGNTLRSWAADERARVATSRMDTAIARAELEALTAQLPPAVIAQALRQIRGVLAHDTLRARELIGLLASVMRESFRREHVKSVPLRDELAAVQRFVKLQHALGLADVALHITVDSNVGRSPVPHLLLHTMVRDSLAGGVRTLSIDARRHQERIAFSITATGLAAGVMQQLATRVERVCGVLVQQDVADGAAFCTWSMA